MEALLTGIPQFIVASVNALITATEATYLIRLDTLFRERKIRLNRRVKWNWRLLLAGWWALTFCTLLVIGRIVASAWFPDQIADAAQITRAAEVSHGVFICLDLAIVSLMGLGYFLLAIVAALAWGCFWRGPWRGMIPPY